MVLSYTPSENSQKIYAARYLDEDADTVEKLHRRVSGGNDDYFQLMHQGLFLPNSPTLFNAGTKNGGTLSACFVFDIADCLLGDWPQGGLDSPFPNSILGTVFKAACVAKAGGGVGYYLGNIRRKGAEVKSTHKKACGPVTVVYFLNQLNQLITQGGKRALAQMGVLPCWHPDARLFIHAKDEEPHKLSSFNLSMSWTNEWLRKIDWDHVERTDGPIDDETGLWYEHCFSAWRTGCPGILFYDTVNASNPTPHLGAINATNPCGETPNINDEPCNLGSAALSRFFKRVGMKWVFLWDEYIHWLKIMIRFMDDILDWNVFPHPDITKMALATRKLGLGVMGYADALALLNIPYDSQDAVDWGGELVRVNAEVTQGECVQMAETKGPYPAWESDPRPIDKRPKKSRNSTRTSIAPTGTINILADASSSIEPHYDFDWERTTGEGIKLKENIQVRDMLGDFVPKISKQIAPEWHVRHMAAWQKHTCLGVSKTVNLPGHATVSDVSNTYRMMWELKCKGGTIFRDNCRPEQVLRSSKLNSVFLEGNIDVYEGLKTALEDYANNLNRELRISGISSEPLRKKLPKERFGPTIKFDIGGMEGYFFYNTYPDGNLGEIFIELANDGSTLAGMTKSWAKDFSVALQHGTPLETLVKLHKNSVFEPRGMTGDAEVPTCSSLPDYIVRKLEIRFLKKDLLSSSTFEQGTTGQYCPDCSGSLVREGPCFKCLAPGCGFSKC